MSDDAAGARGTSALRADAGDLALGTGLVALGLVLGLGALLLRPDRTRGADAFLFGDQGYNFWVVDRLLAGAGLYADVAYQYGPVPAYLHTAAAAVFGNTLATFYGYFLVASLLNVLLAYLAVRGVASRAAAGLVVGLGLSASLLVPGSLLGGTTNAVYVPAERTLVLLATLLWTPPWMRSARRAMILGLVIGGWQTVRFGGGVFLGIALVATDLVALWWTRRARGGTFRGWLRLILLTAGVATLVELLLALIALLTLPGPIARDYIWPAFVLESYAGWVTPEVRWPSWGGWNLLIGQYLSPIAGAAAGLLALGWYVARRFPGTNEPAALSRDARAIRLLLPFLFFLLGSVGLFRMVYHFLMFAWALVIPAAWLFDRGGRAVRVAVVLLLLPPFAVNVRSIFLTRPVPDQQSFRTPSGEVLWGTRANRDELARLTSRLSAAAGPDEARQRRPSALVIPVGAGFHHFYQVASPIRQLWFLPGLVRPYDEAQIVSSLGVLDAVVLRDPSPEMRPDDPCSWRRGDLFSPTTCAAIATRLEGEERIGRYLIFPVRR